MMVDRILTSNNAGGGITIARIKVGTPDYRPQSTGLTDAESRLADILDISTTVMDRTHKTRRLDGFLRFFQSFLRFVNADPAKTAIKPQSSPIDIEYIKVENPYAAKTDKTV
jgi:hypothetical protein